MQVLDQTVGRVGVITLALLAIQTEEWRQRRNAMPVLIKATIHSNLLNQEFVEIIANATGDSPDFIQYLAEGMRMSLPFMDDHQIAHRLALAAVIRSN